MMKERSNDVTSSASRSITSRDDLSRHMPRVAKALLGTPNQSLSKQGKEWRYGSLSRGDRTEVADGNSGAGPPAGAWSDISEGAPPRGTRWLVAEVCDE